MRQKLFEKGPENVKMRKKKFKLYQLLKKISSKVTFYWETPRKFTLHVEKNITY